MAKKTLTDRQLKSLKTTQRQTEVWDASFTDGSFGVRVTKAGRKTFILRYRANGRHRKMTIGTYPAMTLSEARKKARAELVKVDRGEDPQAERKKKRRAETFEQLGQLYLERHARVHKRPRSVAEDERILRVYLSDWNKRKVADIQRRDIIDNWIMLHMLSQRQSWRIESGH